MVTDHPGDGMPEIARDAGELIDALQAALLLAAGFERALVDTPWGPDALALKLELDRAARAAHRLRVSAQDMTRRARQNRSG